ncbi:MAG: class I SAM-dependent methyltransferase [Candidatus Krumholzibacteria bacterium]|nr:class I SAM-dependent methyltransferase [Candidatus Krumholzibacteria bacterium]
MDRPGPGGGLAGESYWDGVHGRPRPRAAPPHVRIARRLLPAAVRSRMSSYEDYLLWNSIYPKFLPSGKGLRVVEIGSAPGGHLTRMREVFGWEPFGVEASPAGAALNRERFASAGIDPRNLIEGDIFDRDIAAPLAGSFDIVVSRGFIEHFPDPAPAIDRHLDLLAPGGTLVVSIPNMRGANFLQARLLNPSIIPLHNRDIMRMDAFTALFRDRQIETLFAGYYGTCNAGLFIHASGAGGRILRLGADAAQALLNLLMRLLLGKRGLESSLLSPNLLFIGRRND